MFVPVSPPPPSREAQELAGMMVDLVRAYRDANPDLDRTDLDQAMMLARSSLRSEVGGTAVGPVLVAVILGAVMMLGLLLVMVRQGGAVPWALVAVIVGAIVAIAVGVLAVGRR